MTRLEARRVAAPGYAGDVGPRSAVDIILNGESLSLRLDAAPYDVEEVAQLHLDRAWFTGGSDVPLFNCTCGDPDCGGVVVEVINHGDTIEWIVDGLPRPIRFNRNDLHRTLQIALSASQS